MLTTSPLLSEVTRASLNAKELAGKMFLRAGDFIEDKFGQAQRKLICSAADAEDANRQVELCKFFGCYIIAWPEQGGKDGVIGGGGECGYTDPHSESPTVITSQSRVLVCHLKGRKKYNDAELDKYQALIIEKD
jgi:hypothetical protein